MAGRGPTPKTQRQRPTDEKKRVRGTPKAAPGVGWQHGAIPKAPDGLMAASRTAWATWFKAWWAANWSKEDLPGLRHVILLYDQVERGEFQRSAELRLSMDTYGITPKGQQDRRWTPPKVEKPEKKAPTKKTAGRYGHLKAVSS